MQDFRLLLVTFIIIILFGNGDLWSACLGANWRDVFVVFLISKICVMLRKIGHFKGEYQSGKYNDEYEYDSTGVHFQYIIF